MRNLRRILYIILVIVFVPLGYMTLETLFPYADINAIPPLEPGDLIFQTMLSSQALPIMVATESAYTHVGVVVKEPSGVSVIQAARTVIKTPLAQFIHAGWGYKFTVMRYVGITREQREAIAAQAYAYLGKPYNYVFYMDSPDTIYCSELPYLLFTHAGLHLAPLQTIGDLNVNNVPVRKLFASRWHMHPACQGKNMSYESCWQKVMGEPIITPVHLAQDAHLISVYSNYPF